MRHIKKSIKHKCTKSSRRKLKPKCRSKSKTRSYKKNRKSRKSTKSKRRKQTGGGCSLGYAMVKGMNIPAINNVEGDITHQDTYARLNGNSNCVLAGNNNASMNHPKLNTF
jgi:hypothetical protein